MDDLADEHEALLQFLYMAPVGLVQLRPDGEILMLNPVSSQLLMPLSRDGSLSNLFTALEAAAPDLRTQVQAFAAPQGMVCEGVHIPLRAAERSQAEVQVLSLNLLKLDAQRLMAVLSDVTVQLRRERMLRQNEAWLNAILGGVHDYALVGLDAEGRVQDWNASVGRVTGFGREAVLGRSCAVFYPDDATTPERVLDRLREADTGGWSLDEGWRRRADGSRFWGSTLIAPLRERAEAGPEPLPLREALGGAVGAEAGAPPEAERAYCLVMRDITDKREASEQQRLATACDHLTGIGNRRAFFEAAELEIARWKRAPRPLALVLFDADHFKRINDTHGHAGGDAVLRHFAALLSSRFRQVDVVARVGGEEFAVLLPSTGLAGATTVAERLRQAVESQAVAFDGASIRYTISGGIAMMHESLDDLEALMKGADRALYAAKGAGRNRIACADAA